MINVQTRFSSYLYEIIIYKIFKNWILQKEILILYRTYYFSRRRKNCSWYNATKIERKLYCREYFSLAQLLRRGKSSINRKIVAQRWKWLEVNVSNPFTPLKKAL